MATTKKYGKKHAASLWLKVKLLDAALKNVLDDQEINDLKFGKRWVETVLEDVQR